MNQPLGRAKVVSPECREIITDTITSQVSANGQQPDLGQHDPALALILAQDADGPQQIQLPVCPAPQQLANLE